MYIIDNYVKRLEGEIIEIKDLDPSERNIYTFILNKQDSTDSESLESHICRKCPLNSIKDVKKNTFLFRTVALELFLMDGRNYFLTFESKKIRDSMVQRLQSKILSNSNSKSDSQDSTMIQQSGESHSASLGLVLNTVFGRNAFTEWTQKWVNGEISNFCYLMLINTMAGRTYNDLTQYPIFPWILSDYTSDVLDLNDPKTFRDLSLPMGAQKSKRASIFKDRFETWEDPILPPCHYGTHYSSAMIVCSFLIRLEPFTQHYLKLQGGTFDHANRLFHSIQTSWESESCLNTTDGRELIPVLVIFYSL